MLIRSLRRARPVGLAVAMLVLVPAGLARAQVPATDTLIVKHRFESDTESVRVELVRQVVYRIELDRRDAFPRVRQVDDDLTDPVLVPITREGRRFIEVFPAETGEYDVSVDLTPTTLTLYGDAGASLESRRRRGGANAVRLGGELGVASFGGYRVGDPPEDGNTGTSVEGCLAILAGPFGTCIGAFRDFRSQQDRDITWFFIEARIRLARARLGPTRLHVGLSVRGAQGSLNREGMDPSMIAPGLWAALQLNRGATARGVYLRIASSYAFIDNSVLSSSERSLRASAGVAYFP